MIKQFYTYEEAALFVGKMRDEGYFAEILDEGAGFLYGANTTGGFRVMISELKAEDEEEFPDDEFKKNDSFVQRFLRASFLAVLAAAGFSAFVVFLKTFQNRSFSIGPDLPLTVVFLIVVGILGSFMGRAIWRLAMVAKDPNHKSREAAKIVIALIAIVTAFCTTNLTIGLVGLAGIYLVNLILKKRP